MASKCKICNDASVEKFLSFGKMPLGNGLLKPGNFDDEGLFDLDIGFCTKCKLAQQITPPPKESLIKDYTNYVYMPFGDTVRNNLIRLGNSIVDDLKLEKNSFLVDIGSNDGTLLGAIKDRCKIIGIEPAVRISQIARDNGINTITGFFTTEIADKVIREHGNADVVVASQVMQHVPDISQFVKDAYKLLKPEGTLIIEGRYFTETLRKRSYDTIYHEMLYFFTLTSIANLMKHFGLIVYRADEVDIHGGSFRIYAKKSEVEVGRSVKKLLEKEETLGVSSLETYKAFAKDVFELRDQLNSLIRKLSQEGKIIIGYGAPSTSTTLLNFSNVSNREIAYIVDDSPLKQGLYTPGTHIPIVKSDELDKRKPDYIIVLAWRLKEEIIPKVKRYAARIIIPLPKVEVLD